MQIYTYTSEEIIEKLGSDPNGLTSHHANQNLDKFGKNIVSIKGTSWFKKVIEPFKSVFVLILIIAAFISLVQKEPVDAIIIITIIVISAFIYYAQSFSTERALNALKKHDKQIVKVLRDGNVIELQIELLVPGDMIQLAEGEKVPADRRVIHSENLRCGEALLTGESKPVSKQNQALQAQKEIYEQSNMLFQGTFVIAGSTQALVVATGNNTEFGKLAKLSATDQPVSPVQKKIDKLVTQIVLGVSIAAIATLLLTILRGISFTESVRFVLSLTVSVVPEGLPVAVSVILALGMNRMAKKNALVRTLPAIENIGTVTLIATDKTGTLTKNLLKVQDVWQLQNEDLANLCQKIKFCINAKNGVMHDPLDNALDAFAKQYHKTINSQDPLKILPFEQAYAMSGNVYRNQSSFELYIKGAPGKIIDRCNLSNKQSALIHNNLIKLTTQGYRVIAIALNNNLNFCIQHFKDLPPKCLEFVALVAVADELREESKSAIAQALGAGVKVCMITGDHFETSFAIAKKLGLITSREQVFDTRNIDKLSNDQLEKIVQTVRVYSRVIPENKFRILELFKKHEITAMTGDGVNDVPALVNAHVGFAMGSGSQIAKEAGDIILLDDNFNSIINALKEGRKIYDNIRRMLFYLLATNLGEAMIMIGALLMGLPLPLVAVQILWVNLVTDTCFVIPLGLEPSEADVLNRPPRRANKPVIGRRSVTRLLIIASLMTLIGLGTFNYFIQNNTTDYAITITFMVIVVMQWANAFNARSEWQSVFKRISKLNLAFIFGLTIAIALQLIASYGPLKNVLHVTTVNTTDIVYSSLISFVLIIFCDEIFKLLYKQKQQVD